MRYIRVYADEVGESHIEDLALVFSPVAFAPPAPPLHLSPLLLATGARFVHFPAGWDGDWHLTPHRQLFVFLSGEVEGETSDGAHRRLGPGDAALLEDTTGKGHRSRAVNGEALA